MGNPNGRPQAHEVAVPLNRDIFTRTLIRELAGTLEDVVGIEEASGYISVVGASIGEQINQSYKSALRVSALSRDQVRATGRAIASIDRLFEASGATALGNDQPVQRFWRDAHAGRVHAANDPERAYQIFGNNEFGLPPQDTMV